MVRAVIRNYRTKKKEKDKKAAFISFPGGVSAENFDVLRKSLIRLYGNKYDAYIFILDQPQLLTAHAIKLLFLFLNTGKRQTGIIVKEDLNGLVRSLRLDEYFETGTSERSVLLKMEGRAGI